MFRRIPEDVANDAHRRLGGIDEGVADHKLFEDVVLDGAFEEALLHTLLLRCSYVPGSWADRSTGECPPSFRAKLQHSVMSDVQEPLCSTRFSRYRDTTTPRKRKMMRWEAVGVSCINPRLSNLRREVNDNPAQECNRFFSGIQEPDHHSPWYPANQRHDKIPGPWFLHCKYR